MMLILSHKIERRNNKKQQSVGIIEKDDKKAYGYTFSIKIEQR